VADLSGSASVTPATGAEALSGLARAFFFAGTRSLLVSHWEVASESTVQLITKAVAELKVNPKIGRAEALRRQCCQCPEWEGLRGTSRLLGAVRSRRRGRSRAIAFWQDTCWITRWRPMDTQRDEHTMTTGNPSMLSQL
jgi:hypothetical protein